MLDIDSGGREITTALGLRLDHSARMSSSAEFRRLGPLDSARLNFGTQYTLTDKYLARGRLTYNTDENDIQTVGGSLERRFPNLTLRAGADYDNITGETGFGFGIEPNLGAEDERRRRALESISAARFVNDQR